jgi:hypothetical protein
MEKMAVDCVEDGLRNLCACAVVKEREGRLLMERGKVRADAIAREGDGLGDG